MRKVTVKETGVGLHKVYRVMDGFAPAGEPSAPSDGGGFTKRAQAEGLAARINQRRERKEQAEAAQAEEAAE